MKCQLRRRLTLGSVSVVIVTAAACTSERLESPTATSPDGRERAATSDGDERAATSDGRERAATSDGDERTGTTALAPYVDAGKPDGPLSFVQSDYFKAGYPPSFDPSGYSKACTTKAECAVVPIITNCGTCCGWAAIRADEGVADLEAVQVACAAHGWVVCSMACSSVHAECRDGGCIICREDPCPPAVVTEVPLGKDGD